MAKLSPQDVQEMLETIRGQTRASDGAMVVIQKLIEVNKDLTTKLDTIANDADGDEVDLDALKTAVSEAKTSTQALEGKVSEITGAIVENTAAADEGSSGGGDAPVGSRRR